MAQPDDWTWFNTWVVWDLVIADRARHWELPWTPAPRPNFYLLRKIIQTARLLEGPPEIILTVALAALGLAPNVPVLIDGSPPGAYQGGPGVVRQPAYETAAAAGTICIATALGWCALGAVVVAASVTCGVIPGCREAVLSLFKSEPLDPPDDSNTVGNVAGGGAESDEEMLWPEGGGATEVEVPPMEVPPMDMPTDVQPRPPYFGFVPPGPLPGPGPRRDPDDDESDFRDVSPTDRGASGPVVSVTLNDILNGLAWQTSEELAAYLFLGTLNPISVKLNVEYFSVIVKKDGKFAFLPGQVGTENESTGFVESLIGALDLPDIQVVAWMHTHGRYEGPHSNQFSEPDVEITGTFRITGYLGTPSGRFLRILPGEHFGTDLGPLPPSPHYQ